MSHIPARSAKNQWWSHVPLGAGEHLGRMARRKAITMPQAALVSQRAQNAGDADRYLAATLEDLDVDPFRMKDMDATATKLAALIMNGDTGTIGAIGDYDVDGSCASAILHRFLHMLNVPLTVHIPDRFREGYGPSRLAVDHLARNGVRHLLTLDCGTTAFDPLQYAADTYGMDIMVVDHHEPHGQGVVPAAATVVNANQDDDTSPYGGLCASGVAYFLVMAVDRKLDEAGWYENHPRPPLRSLLDLVALGTVSDVMKLEGVNRVLVREGLEVMAEGTNRGIRALLNQLGINRAPIAEDIAFLLGPAINAAGRLHESDGVTADDLRQRLWVLPDDLFTLSSLGYRLLTTNDDREAEFLAQRIVELNSKRQDYEDHLFEEAAAQVEAQLASAPDLPCLVVHAPHWHQGVMGIVAGRLKEMYGLPTVVLAGSGASVKGSARSIEGVDIGRAIIETHHEGWLSAAGGHVMAAGLSMDERHIDGFRNTLAAKIAQQVAASHQKRNLPIHFTARPSAMTGALIDTLAIGEPYGTGNPRPNILLENVVIERMVPLGVHQNHYQLTLRDAENPDSEPLQAVIFRARGTQLEATLQRAKQTGAPLQLAGTVRMNRHRGKEAPQFMVEDAFAGPAEHIMQNGGWKKVIHLPEDFAPLHERPRTPGLDFTRAAIADRLSRFSDLMQRLLGPANDGTYTISASQKHRTQAHDAWIERR